jgi:hypothetical protein
VGEIGGIAELYRLELINFIDFIHYYSAIIMGGTPCILLPLAVGNIPKGAAEHIIPYISIGHTLVQNTGKGERTNEKCEFKRIGHLSYSPVDPFVIFISLVICASKSICHHPRQWKSLNK